MSQYELGIIGAGNMAEAIVRGVVGSGMLAGSAIIVSDVSPQRLELMRTIGANTTQDNAEAGRCPHVLLAVKPQVMADMLAKLAPSVAADAMIISIAAGIATVKIDALLGHRGRIVRVMPNTPMLVGQGMSALAAGPRATQADLDWAGRLFATAGRTVFVNEPQIDAVTAVSGSGPAYFFYLIEAMVAAGTAEGLDAATALTLATQTCAGAAALLTKSGEDPGVLRAKVTSPNGTTQRAIETFDAKGVKDAAIAAVRACAARSRELGK